MTDSQHTPDSAHAVDSSDNETRGRTLDPRHVASLGRTLGPAHATKAMQAMNLADSANPALSMKPTQAVGEGRSVARENPFHTPAPFYGRVRPEYPQEAVDAVCGSHVGGRIADIGAGTGKLTRLLLERGAQVVAVEPSAAMREQLDAILGGAEALQIVAANAEDTRLPAHSVDVAAYAQSWHWMDPEAAGREADRIVRPGGHMAIVWNQMNVELPWVHRLTRIMRSGDVHRPDKPPRLPEPWGEPELTMLAWEDQVTPEGLLELGTTRSSYLRQNEAGRARMQDNLRWYLYEHLEFVPGQEIALPYTTQVWVAHRRSEL